MMAGPEGIEPPPPSSKHGILSIELRAEIKKPRYRGSDWCSHRELNSEFVLTKDVLYHLTIGAINYVSTVDDSDQTVAVFFV